MLPNNAPKFQPLTGLFEPSGIQQLADGRFLVVEDEKQFPFSLVTINPSGDVSSTPVRPQPQDDDALWKLDDLEAITLDHAGYLYAITSHSRDKEGNEQKSREKLVRFRIENGHVTSLMLFRELKPALIAAHPILAAAAQIRDVKNIGGLNIEALEMSADQQHLLIGFRSPLLNQQALIAHIENPTALFEAGEVPRVSALQTLNLDGQGIRSIAFISALNGYLILSGPIARKQAPFQLWFWNGQRAAAARRVSATGLHSFEHAEGISYAVIDGRPHIIIVSDDGSRQEQRFAQFLLLELDQLKIAAT